MAEQSNPGLKAVVTGTLLGVAAAALGGYTMYSSKVAPVDTNVKGGYEGASMTEEAQGVKNLMKRDMSVVDTAPAGATINGVPRVVPLFYAPELWQVALVEAERMEVGDIYDPASPAVHGSIPNVWFISNEIEADFCKANGRALDADADGFTNEEEYAAKTCPSANNSYPDLVRAGDEKPKLEVVAINNAKALITTDNMFVDAKNPASVNIRIYGSRAEYTPIHKVTVKPGESFDLSAQEKKSRFTVVRFDVRDYPDFSGSMVKENVVVIRDNVTASSDKEFVLRAGKTPAGHRDEKDEKVVKGRMITDTTVTLRTTAGTAKGKTFSVQLGAPFTIPGGKADGSELRATLVATNGSGTVNIKLDGVESDISIPKASGNAAAASKNRKK